MTGKAPPRHLWTGSLLVVIAVGLAAASFVGSLVVYSIEASTAPWVSRIYAALDMFTGAYIPLGRQSATPSSKIAFVGLAALSVTFLAAFTAIYELSTKVREWFQAHGAGSNLIVIGSGEAAADILRAYPTPTGSNVLLITAEETGPAAVAAAGIAPRIVADLDAFETTALRERTRRAARVAVATDDDGLNIRIADAIASWAQPNQKVMALIADAKLADERRPSVIDGALPEQFGLSCPAENIAEEVCHKLDVLGLTDDVITGADGLAIFLDLDDGDLAETVALWVRRYVWSRRYLLSETSQKNPARLEIVDLRQAGVVTDPTFLEFSRVRVVATEDPGVSARRTLLALRNEKADSSAGLDSYVAVTTSHLIGKSVAGNPRIAVVDPTESAWDEALIFDDIVDQWGRAFHQAYNVIYGKNSKWAEVREGRKGQSSRLAAVQMLKALKKQGYRLVKTLGDAAPVDPLFSDEHVKAMAKLEHEDWRVREYLEQDGTRSSVASERPLNIEWADLSTDEKNKNVQLIRQTYPGMAALFGYQIQRSSADA